MLVSGQTLWWFRGIYQEGNESSARELWDMVAAVPRASSLMRTTTGAGAGIPVAAAAIVLGGDALLDRVRTSVKFGGNCLTAAVIALSEGHRLATA